MASMLRELSRSLGEPASRSAASPLGGHLQAAATAAVRAVARRLDLDRGPVSDLVERHGLSPAAVRIERSHHRRGGESAEQTAVTLWLGEGPALPGGPQAGWAGPGAQALRATLRVGASMLGAAALAAATTVAARLDQQRLGAGTTPPPRRLISGGGAPPG